MKCDSFFLISGYVLSMSIHKDNNFMYFKFIKKNICSLYIPLLVIIFIASILFYCTDINKNSLSFTSQWFNNIGNSPYFTSTLINNLCLTGNDVNKIVPVIWYIVVQVRIIIFFPLIYLMVNRIDFKFLLIIISLLYVLGGIMLYLNIRWQLGQTFFQVPSFILGSILYTKSTKLYDKNLLFIVCSIIFYMVLVILKSIYNISIPQTISDIFLSFIAFTIIYNMNYFNRLQLFFDNSVLYSIGKMSYSLYLTHTVTIVASYHFLSNYFNIPIILLLTIINIFLVSWLYHILITNTIKKYFRRWR
ncbi:acyltransferase family protein [Enterococcus hirae]